MEPKIDTFQVFIVPKIWTVELAAVVEESEEEEMELVKEKTIGNVDPVRVIFFLVVCGDCFD